MYCNQCGAAIGETATLCPKCGRGVPPIAIQKKLVRPRRDRKVAGVCAALGNYLDIDVTLVRIVWAVAILFAGGGLLAYLIGWIVIPEEPEIVLLQTSRPNTV